MKAVSYLLFVILLMASTGVSAQQFGKPDSSPMDLAISRGEDQRMTARVIYSRPQKNGRDVFGKLIPFGQVWRTGANEATEISLVQAMEVDGERIAAGTYTLFTIPYEDEWAVVFNSKTQIWGLDYDEKFNVAQFCVASRKAAAPIESLSMAFRQDRNGFSLMIGWDDRYVEIPFRYPKD